MWMAETAVRTGPDRAGPAGGSRKNQFFSLSALSAANTFRAANVSFRRPFRASQCSRQLTGIKTKEVEQIPPVASCRFQVFAVASSKCPAKTSLRRRPSPPCSTTRQGMAESVMIGVLRKFTDFTCRILPCTASSSVISIRFADPIVQWPRTLPFHGGDTGSNPVRVAIFIFGDFPCKQPA